MRIGISGTFWAEPHVGSGQYVRHLVQHLPQVAPQHEYLLFLPAYTQAAVPKIPGVAVDRVPTPLDSVYSRFAKIWYEQVELPRAAARLAVDVLHVPYYAPPIRQLTPVVTTVHDIIPLMLSEYRGSAWMRMYTALATQGVTRSAELVAVSDHTRDDLIDVLGINAQRISTIYEAVDPIYQPQSAAAIQAVRDKYTLLQPFFYYIGGFDARKNLPLLLRAFGRVHRRYPQSIQLVIGGQRPQHSSTLYPALDQIILDEDLASSVVFTGRVSSAENAALYAGAEAFVWPSRYEGFGLPPLEAMASGAPVLAANSSSIPEIVGTGGMLLPPNDTEAWAMSMVRILTEPDWQQELRQRGYERAQIFNWSIFAAQIVQVYERIPARSKRLRRHKK